MSTHVHSLVWALVTLLHTYQINRLKATSHSSSTEVALSNFACNWALLDLHTMLLSLFQLLRWSLLAARRCRHTRARLRSMCVWWSMGRTAVLWQLWWPPAVVHLISQQPLVRGGRSVFEWGEGEGCLSEGREGVFEWGKGEGCLSEGRVCLSEERVCLSEGRVCLSEGWRVYLVRGGCAWVRGGRMCLSERRVCLSEERKGVLEWGKEGCAWVNGRRMSEIICLSWERREWAMFLDFLPCRWGWLSFTDACSQVWIYWHPEVLQWHRSDRWQSNWTEWGLRSLSVKQHFCCHYSQKP